LSIDNLKERKKKQLTRGATGIYLWDSQSCPLLHCHLNFHFLFFLHLYSRDTIVFISKYTKIF